MQTQNHLPRDHGYPMIFFPNDQLDRFFLHFLGDKTLKIAPKSQPLAKRSIRLDGDIVPSGDRGYNHP
jgi:hypothetical protein